MEKHTGECPDGYIPFFGHYDVAHLVSDTASRCGFNSYYLNGECVDYEQSDCKDGFQNKPDNIATFMPTTGGNCPDGHETLVTHSNIDYIVYSSGVKCGFGQYPTASGCVNNNQNDCPENFYEVFPTNSFARRIQQTSTDEETGEQITELVCADNYELYTDTETDLCAMYTSAPMPSVCTPLCDVGYTHTHADTCARTCTYPNMNALHTSTGLTWPLYLDKTTIPSINIRTDYGICYVNLLSGVSEDTINVNYGGDTYHAVE